MPESDDRLLHRWLLRTAAEYPDAVAILEDGQATTFTELASQAQSMAAAFAELGVRQGDRVALVLPKTTDAIIAVFASLLARAAYVPIHPRWPEERIRLTIEDCAARVVIEMADGALRVRLRAGAGSVGQPSEETAIILFTSGSTGIPKGVVLSHAAVGAFVKWTAAEFGITALDRVASPSPLGFDLSTFDIFNMALTGAACVLAPDAITWMPRFLVQFLRETRITCWYAVPSILTGMLQDGGLASFGAPDLRLVLFAGEVFPSPKVALLASALPQAVCANLYGPTETNVVTWHRVPAAFDASQPLPIGQACPYAAVRMDAETGELLAGGESTMSGYWNRPEKTARAFVEIEGTRYYRTGDRVTLGPSGDYTFVGRLDRQVKRRGFRIELGEVEAALARHASVEEAAVVACEAPSGGTEIVAFVRSLSPEGRLLVEIKRHCVRLLPLYMLPDRVVFVERIPKGNRGKIDYAALRKAAEDARRGD